MYGNSDTPPPKLREARLSEKLRAHLCAHGDPQAAIEAVTDYDLAYDMLLHSNWLGLKVDPDEFTEIARKPRHRCIKNVQREWRKLDDALGISYIRRLARKYADQYRWATTEIRREWSFERYLDTQRDLCDRRLRSKLGPKYLEITDRYERAMEAKILPELKRLLLRGLLPSAREIAGEFLHKRQSLE